jgi:hypothetical protein
MCMERIRHLYDLAAGRCVCDVFIFWGYQARFKGTGTQRRVAPLVLESLALIFAMTKKHITRLKCIRVMRLKIG